MNIGSAVHLPGRQQLVGEWDNLQEVENRTSWDAPVDVAPPPLGH